MVSESRIRSGRKKGFIVLYREAAQDARLSLESRGLFALMMSLPENWDYSVSGLAVKAGCGKDKIRRLLGELQDVGYLIREQSHDSGGKFAGNIYVLQDEAPPLSGNTDNGENRQRETPLPEIPTQKNIDLKEEKTLKNPPMPPKGGRDPARKSKYALQDDAKPILRAYVGQDEELAKALADLIEIRTVKRAINSKTAITKLLRRLDECSGGNREDKLRIIDQSITSSWLSVFPLKGQGTTRPVVSQGQPFDRVMEEEGTYLL